MAAETRLDKAHAGDRRIVVVDDDPEVLEVCGDALLEAGYRVATFGRGGEALRALAETGADVLVVDWEMPDLDGVEVARRARALDPRLAVLMITGNAGEAATVAHRAGIQRIIDKPFYVEDLVAAVTALADGRDSM